MDRKEVIYMNKNPNPADKMYKGSSHTYFFNIKEAKTGKKYLQVTQSRFDKTANAFKRNSLYLFPEELEGVKKMFQEVKLS